MITQYLDNLFNSDRLLHYNLALLFRIRLLLFLGFCKVLDHGMASTLVEEQVQVHPCLTGVSFSPGEHALFILTDSRRQS